MRLTREAKDADGRHAGSCAAYACPGAADRARNDAAGLYGVGDQTVLASALPAIGRQFDNFTDLPWLITTYLIAATATTPLYGKVSDIHGRRFAMAIAVFAYIAGSFVCALAPNMTILILGRALHGIGGGGLTSIGMVVLGDVASPKDRARYYAYFSITYTTAGACGPLLGGLLSDYVHWSAIFWLNIPLGIAAIFFTLRVMRGLPRHERPHKLDFLGAALIVIATVSFMFAITAGGVRGSVALSRHDRPSPFCSHRLRAVCCPADDRAGAPYPPAPSQGSRRCFAIATNSLGWGGIVALNIFLPVYLQEIMGMSATMAGLSLMVLMGTLNASAGIASFFIGRHARYKIIPMIGLAAAALTIWILAWRAGSINIWGFEFLLLLLGTGFGPLAPLSTVAVQNSVPSYQFGTAVGALSFLRSLYSTILVAIFGAIVLRGTPGAASVGSFQTIFIIAAVTLTVAFVAMYMIEEKPLHTTHVK